ncbi:hypothetical protein MSAN_01374600 [Mycena sanguinolenta]|uniref:Uncharacterized protein n=1 Tax=Mycena sanguinolenta TaxID=230812 RepID=A0A8H7D070_9AGAR|nr:hypothetical protein MSAN_01374600 [Mycena sanguinolenta]
MSPLPADYDWPPMDCPLSKQIVVDNRVCSVTVDNGLGLYWEDPMAKHFLEQSLREDQGFILLYSITSRQSFERLEGFLQTMKRVKGDDIVTILVGNKCDMPDAEREVSKKTARRVHDSLHASSWRRLRRLIKMLTKSSSVSFVLYGVHCGKKYFRSRSPCPPDRQRGGGGQFPVVSSCRGLSP